MDVINKDNASMPSLELTTSLAAPPVPARDNQLMAGFRGWLRGRVSEETADYYAGVVARGGWPPQKGKHVKAWRQYIHYLFSAGTLKWGEYQAYLAFLRTPADNRHVTVEAVPIETILAYRHKLERAGMGSLHTMLLGGSRLKHIITAITGWMPDEEALHPTGSLEARLHCTTKWCRYYIGIREGSKHADYIYYPKHGHMLPSIVTQYRALRDRLRKMGVQAKLYRKFATQRLSQLAFEERLPQDAVNLIVSRGLSVTGAHYLNTREWADRLFGLYVDWLVEKGLLRQGGSHE